MEIQDTIQTRKGNEPHRQRGPVHTMKRSVNISVAIMTFLYMMVAIFGYLSVGDDVQYYILDSYKQAPAWVIDIANAMVMVSYIKVDIGSRYCLFNSTFSNNITFLMKCRSI